MNDTSSDTPGTASAWLSEIKRAQRTGGMEEWHNACEKIRKRYRYEGSQESKVRKYQLLWSNMETMKPAVYTKPPTGAVLRRWNDKDPTARVASEMLERCINYTFEANDFDSRFKRVRDDYLLYARGVARIYYEPVMQDNPAFEGTDDLDTEAVEGDEAASQELASEQPAQILKFEHVKISYVQRRDFVHAWARTWDEVPWLAFRSFLTRKELRARFPETADNIALDASPERGENSRSDASSSDDGTEDKATIWEIWDRAGDRVLWVAKGYGDILEEGEPYLKIEGFYPCPQPAFGTMTNDTLVPRPDYVYYQDQAEEIDELTARIGAVTESLKVVGFYSAAPSGEAGSVSASLEMAIRPGFENKLIGIPSWDAFKQGGGGKGMIEWLPIDQVVKVLEACVANRQQLINDVNQIYGISDIMRGDGDAQETATAQSIKAQYGSVRIRDRQQELARFCRDICRMVGEVIATLFQPETIMAMANMPLPTDADIQQQQMMATLQAQAAQLQAQPMGHPQGQPMPMGAPSPMMGHNGGPPMAQPPQPAPQPGLVHA